MEHNNQKNELYECNEVRNRHAWSRSCRRTTRSFFDENDKAYIILVDAGNYCNGETIAKFVKESAAAGFQNLKGHRSVGGMRASIYNAMPEEGVDKLIKFIEDFEKANS